MFRYLKSIIKPFSHKKLLRSKIHQDLIDNKLKRFSAIQLYNHHIVFPFLITLYIILLLIEQTKLFGIHLWDIYLSINQNFILFLVIISGIGTSREVKPNIEEKYIVEKKSKVYAYGYYALVFWLSLLSLFIIRKQTLELGWISYAISLLSSILIALVGIMLTQEEEV